MGGCARPWALALLEAARGLGPAPGGPEGGRPDARVRLGRALERAAAAVDAEAGFRSWLEDPSVPKARKAAVLAEFLGPAEPGDPTTALLGRFMALLARGNRLPALAGIAVAYRRALDLEEGLVRVRLRSARAFPPAMARRLAAAAAASEGGRDFVLEEEIDPGLLGGFTLGAGSALWDRSVAARLKRLEKALARPLPAPTAGGAEGAGGGD